VNAVDYILKPFDKKRVAQSIEKARAKIEAGAGPEEKFETLVRMLESQKPQTAKILIKAAGRLFLTDPKDICYATIEDGVITVATSGHCRYGRPFQLPHPGRTFRKSRSQLVLACAPLFSGQHQSHPRSCALVQELLPVAHGRQETDGDPRQPRPDPPPARTVQSLEIDDLLSAMP
jgi:hypothetical protein